MFPSRDEALSEGCLQFKCCLYSTNFSGPESFLHFCFYLSDQSSRNRSSSPSREWLTAAASLLWPDYLILAEGPSIYFHPLIYFKKRGSGCGGCRGSRDLKLSARTAFTMHATGGQVCSQHMLGSLLAFSRRAMQLSISCVLPRGIR